MRGLRNIGLCLLAAALAACADRPRERFESGFALPAAAAPGELVPGSALPAPQGPAREAARERAVRGFIRRGAPEIPPLGTGERSPTRGGGAITLDFQQADLASVVRVMLEDGLGATFLIDPTIEGTVTLRSNRPLRQEEILPTLEEILRLNDAAIVERDGVFRVLPRAEAGLSAPVVGARDVEARGLTTRVTPLRHLETEDIADVLDSFAPVAGAIRYDPARDLVFTIGTEAEQKTLLDLIEVLDVDYLAGRSFALLPLSDADPAAVADELEVMFARPSGRPDPASRFLPIARMNAILIVADRAGVVEQAREFVRFLDQDAGETPRLHVFEVRNRRAGEVAALLGDIFDAEVGGLSEGATGRQGLSPRRRGTGGAERGLGLGGDIEPAAAEVPERPRPAAAPAPAETPAAEPARAGGALGGRAGVLRLTADESSNAVVALATQAGAQAVENALRRLDTQPLQVMIEATLVEVALNDRLEFGVRWFLESGNFNFSFGDLLGSGAANLFPGFNAAFRTSDVRVTLSALDEVTDVRVLSSPTLMVLDNRVARLQVGAQVPVNVRSTQTIEEADAPIIAETEFRDTGVILEIRPTVNAGGLVVLEIRQEVSDVDETSTDDANPTFVQRVVESTVAVQSGETVALAGLIEEDRQQGSDGLPVLSRIPIVGGLFGTQVDSVRRSELLVLIRPVVVRDQREARAATAELRAKLTTLRPPPEDASVLPF